MASTELPLDRNSGFITEGVHLFKIVKSEEKGSKSSGQPTWYFSCVCQDQGDDQGKNFLLSLSLSEPARFKIDEFFDALELPKKGGSFKHEQAVNRTLKIAIQHGENAGKPVMQAFKMLPATSNDSITVPKVSPSGPESPVMSEFNSGVKKPF
jgi:hypothetical protein